MPSAAAAAAPSISTFLRSLKGTPVDTSIEHLVSLLKRRQIRNSRPCAIATTQLLLRVVADFKGRDVSKLIDRVRHVGQKLTAAQPREMAVGNIVRRVLGLIREVDEDKEEDADGSAMSDIAINPPHQLNDSLSRPALSSHMSTFSPLKHGAIEPASPAPKRLDSSGSSESAGQDQPEAPLQRPPLSSTQSSYISSSAPLATSLFGLLSHPETPSGGSTPAIQQSPGGKASLTAGNLAGLGDDLQKARDIRAEVLDGIREMLDELDQVDEQIAEKALEHIHSNEIILTHTSSMTVQKFLLTAARKRTFTVVHVEAYPNEHLDTHCTIMTGQKAGAADDTDSDPRFKPLTAAGITVILIPDSAVFAIMSRVNKVILGTHSVLANGGLVAAVGALTIASAAKVHKTPVVVLSGVYKLSPVYPFDTDELIEHGDASKVVPFEDGDFVDKIDVMNPLFDYVPADLVDLYITNLGGHAPSYLYRIVADHYRVEDINL
ncbi:MAG: GCD complex subunit gcd7 [Bathelium mastoideum]|nr:MAG: GCD complex subunit gcd7 [Bathelium mastoideum]KAI9688492.1 MAG: GCD complex subunit gcd7 [Bathelium mastoideum]